MTGRVPHDPERFYPARYPTLAPPSNASYGPLIPKNGYQRGPENPYPAIPLGLNTRTGSGGGLHKRYQIFYEQNGIAKNFQKMFLTTIQRKHFYSSLFSKKQYKKINSTLVVKSQNSYNADKVSILSRRRLCPHFMPLH